jgi:hypothetical protein
MRYQAAAELGRSPFRTEPYSVQDQHGHRAGRPGNRVRPDSLRPVPGRNHWVDGSSIVVTVRPYSIPAMSRSSMIGEPRSRVWTSITNKTYRRRGARCRRAGSRTPEGRTPGCPGTATAAPRSAPAADGPAAASTAGGHDDGRTCRAAGTVNLPALGQAGCCDCRASSCSATAARGGHRARSRPTPRGYGGEQV